MAAPTETYIDPGATGSDFGGTAFTDGSFVSATKVLTKVGAFPAATCKAGDKIRLSDNGSGEVTAGLYTIATRTDNDNVILTADIRSGVNDPTDVVAVTHDGTINLAWARVQHALDFTTRDAVGGDRFNVKAGTDDVLAAALSLSTYGATAWGAPLIIQGYTAAADDGGIGGISGNATYTIIAGTPNNVAFIDMHLHNTGANHVVYLGSNGRILRCEIDTNSSGEGAYGGYYLVVADSYVHDIVSRGFRGGYGSMAYNNTFKSCDVEAIRLYYFQFAFNNVVILDSNAIGIVTSTGGMVVGNSIYSSVANTGNGISVDAGNQGLIYNNAVEGFIGVGGVGISIPVNGYMHGHNYAYNNTTNFSLSGAVAVALGNNTELGESPFIDAAAGDFRVKPSVQALGYPTANYPSLSVRSYMDIGALQRKSQMLIHPGMNGGANG